MCVPYICSLLHKDDFDSVTPPPNIPKDRRRRKIRMAQTAPAHTNHNQAPKKAGGKPDADRKQVKSGPETQAERSKMLQTDRKKSVYLQLSGMGRQRNDSDDEKPRKTTLPKPNPKTLLDVMIGLNAFSYVPPPTCSPGELDESRSETRSSFFERDSLCDSSENIAKKFITNWRSKIANRKQSIFRKLELGDQTDRTLARSESIATSCIPEEAGQQSLFRKRKSKWTMRHSMRRPTLPAIDDEEERMEQFLQYVKEVKEKEKYDVHPAFANLGNDKTSERRKSFANWLHGRKNQPKTDPYLDGDDDVSELNDHPSYMGISLVRKDDEFQPTEIGDLMKTILKIKTKFRDPLDSRVRKFLNDIDKLKERDEMAQKALPEHERRRRWIALTRGIDAALAESDDEDEDFTYYNSY